MSHGAVGYRDTYLGADKESMTELQNNLGQAFVSSGIQTEKSMAIAGTRNHKAPDESWWGKNYASLACTEEEFVQRKKDARKLNTEYNLYGDSTSDDEGSTSSDEDSDDDPDSDDDADDGDGYESYRRGGTRWLEGTRRRGQSTGRRNRRSEGMSSTRY